MFILDLIKNTTNKCEQCKKPNYYHVLNFYHRDGRVQFKFQYIDEMTVHKALDNVIPAINVVAFIAYSL